MDVHPVLRGITEASQLQLPRAEPDEQPIESSHLAGVLEFLQLLVPTRHGQLFDFGVKAAGSLGGVTVTTLAEKLWPTRLRQGA
jgi:hypothetical protein